MTQRINYQEIAPRGVKVLAGAHVYINQSGLAPELLAAVYLRVSLINGCAYCIDMHWRDLIRLEVDPRHLNAVAGWREAPFFTERERAALRWAEIVTAIPHADASDAEFAALRTQFSDEEIADLSFAIAAINAWNLLNVSLRNPLPEKP